ncbi:hypothetical protein B0H19DRAFT_1247376 [Mycena capillaripes]|nr:hypothetical protein B0H19DRAFT_1247376 [Mycena capillaripes]
MTYAAACANERGRKDNECDVEKSGCQEDAEEAHHLIMIHRTRTQAPSQPHEALPPPCLPRCVRAHHDPPRHHELAASPRIRDIHEEHAEYARSRSSRGPLHPTTSKPNSDVRIHIGHIPFARGLQRTMHGTYSRSTSVDDRPVR